MLQTSKPTRPADDASAQRALQKRTSGLARDSWNANMASDPRVMWNFECPSCGAKYLKTKIEDQAENREGANCEHCLASFEPREGAYLFQYGLIEHPSAGR
jgi:predicted SprT family Zn-dependent metalloprotease